MKRDELRKILLYIYIFFIELRYFLGRISLVNNKSNIDKVILLSALLFLGIYICINEYTKKHFLECILFLLIGSASYFFSNATNFLIIILTILFIPKKNNNDIKNILKIIFIQRFIFICILFVMVNLGIVENEAFIITKGIDKSVIGYSFGESHPNILAIDIFTLCMLWMCIKNEKISKINYFILMIVGIIAYTITKSRISTFLYFSFILLCALQNKNAIRKFVFKVSRYIFPIIIFINYGLILIYYLFSDKFYFINWINNSIFNGRIGLSLIYFTNLNPTLFGTNIDISIFSEKYSYVAIDNGYVNILFLYGILGLLIFIYLYQHTIKKLIRMNCFIYILSLIIFSIWMSYESNLISIEFNFSLILLCMAFDFNNPNRISNF